MPTIISDGPRMLVVFNEYAIDVIWLMAVPIVYVIIADLVYGDDE